MLELDSPRARRIALGLLALALVVRLAVVAVTPAYELRSDPADYHRHARSIAAGDGYPSSGVSPKGGPTAYRPPVYPYFVGAVYAVAGERPDAVRLAQAGIGTLTVALIGWLAAFSFGRRAGGWALALAAVFPPLIVIGNALTPEALFVPLVLAAMAATLHARSQPGWRWPALAGGLCGLALLTRVNVAPVVPLLALAIWGQPPRLSLRAAARPATLILATALVAVPWTVRNLVELDKLVPISTQHGYTLAGTYNPGSDGDRKYPAAWRVPIVEAERIRAEKGALGEVELGEELGAEARRYVRDRPAYPLKVAFWNSVRLLHLDGLDYARGDNFHIGVDRWLSDAGAIGLWLLLPLAAAGGLMARGSSPHWLFWAVPAALAVTIFVAGEIRFRTPIDPFLLMLGGVALAGLSRVRPSAAG